jgi:hypothetical protein
MARPVERQSLRSVAARLGRSTTSLHRAVQAGLVDRTDLERSAAAWNREHPKPERSAPTTPTGEARRRLEAAKAEEKEIKVRQLKGELIDRERVLRLFYASAKMTREMIEQWPVQHAAPIAAKLGFHDPHLVENVLAESLHDLLLRLVKQMKTEL